MIAVIFAKCYWSTYAGYFFTSNTKFNNFCRRLLWYYSDYERKVDWFWHSPVTYKTSHKLWDQSPYPHYQCCLQVSETVSWRKLSCCYSANMLQHWVGGRVLIYSRKVDHSRISINFSRTRLGLNNFCEILSQTLKNLGK